MESDEKRKIREGGMSDLNPDKEVIWRLVGGWGGAEGSVWTKKWGREGLGEGKERERERERAWLIILLQRKEGKFEPAAN